MQGQRSIIGSLPEILDLEHGSTSGNASIDQQICWNNMRNPTENLQADYMLSSSHINSMYASSVDQDRQNFCQWSLGGPSSSGVQHEASGEEHGKELGWSSSAISCGVDGPRLEERRYISTNGVPLHSVTLNPQSGQSSNCNAVLHNFNLNACPGQGSDNCQLMESSNIYKPDGRGNERIPPIGGSDAQLLPSGSGGYLVEGNNNRTGCSLDGRPRKRKAVEGDMGQSSVSGSSSFFQCAESSVWGGVPAHYNVSSSLSITAPQVNPRLALGVRGLASNGSSDSEVVGRASSHRNFRLRINPSNQEFVPPALFSSGSAARCSGMPSSHQSSRLFPVDHSLNLRSTPSLSVDGSASQNQPLLVTLPALPQNTQPFRWNENSSTRTGNLMTSIALRDAEQANSRSVVGNAWEPSGIVPATELRPFVQNPANSNGTTLTTNVLGNVASTSRAGSNSGLHPLSAPNWIPRHNSSSRNSRRLAEYVRRSLLSSAGGEFEGQNNTYSPLDPVPLASSEEMVISSRTNSQGHHRSHARSGLWLERHGDGVLGVPYPLQTVTAAREGRNRLVVSEIRNVLDLVRRGESLRIEDLMMLDQSVFFGMADIPDRHRDMRLDVDNMSYEELLALEERIGNVSTGLSEETILKRLKQRKYSSAVENEMEAEPCCICREEYNDGEDLGKLDCGHNFHTDCIKKWLTLKNWCPICKTTGLAT
uniref:RING-type E3 ubiquitin transferase n=1 Tax=Rhizophora mucronata TaxID=61149 RepID=A0A2P2LID4_RHIMU